MRISFIPVILLTASLAMIWSGASAADELHVGYVNMQKLMQQSPQARAAVQVMKNKFGDRGQDLVAEQSKIKALQDQITKNGAVMSADQLQDKQNELDDMQRDYSRKQSDLQDDISAEKNQEIAKLQRDIYEAVQVFAKGKKYNLIIGEGVFYADSTVDITDQVLAQLQKEFKSKDSKSGN